jgi:hypothetical protein
MKRALAIAFSIVAAASPAAADPKSDPCSAASLQLGKTTVLRAWQPPEKCTAKTRARTILRTKAELDAAFECENGVAHGVDPKRVALVQVSWNMSPAAVGLDAHDDGKNITLVTRFRRPCPKDPHPMPITRAMWFVLPSSAGERGFAEANCTIDTKCP